MIVKILLSLNNACFEHFLSKHLPLAFNEVMVG